MLLSDRAHLEARYRAALVIFLYEKVYLQTRLFAPVWLMSGELSLTRVFSENRAHKTEEIP